MFHMEMVKIRAKYVLLEESFDRHGTVIASSFNRRNGAQSPMNG